MSAEPGPGPSGDRDPRDDDDLRPDQPAGPGATGDSAGTPQEIASGRYYVWGLEDAEAGQDPYSSCPPEYAGVPIDEIFADADDEAGPAEAWEAGFLRRDVPVTARRAGAAGGFASGGPLDAAPPEPAVAALAEEATGPDGRCTGATDDELIGMLRFWQRFESRGAARKLAVIAELIRRRPAPGCVPRESGGMPEAWGKYCGDELAAATATSGQAAEKTLEFAHDLATRLPGTAKALYDGAIDTYKAKIIADATRVLAAADAAAAEALVLPGIEGKTPGQIRAAIGRAVITIDPGAAQARRERAQKDARVELWREDAGTAAVCGRDLPPADALAADQRITAYARELRAAGLDGTMDQLRARAFLDFTLGVSSFPPPAGGPGAEDQASRDGSPVRSAGGPGPDDGPGIASDGDGRTGQDRYPAAPGPAGPAARINLTIPLATLLGLADRPGEAHGLGAIDPGLARTLAASAATNPRTTWCVTVTDTDGHPTAHGCARPARAHSRRPSGDGTRDGPAFGPQAGRSPPGPDGTGAWQLRIPGAAGRGLAVNIEPLAVTECDHRHESAGYQPSDRLRHLVEVRDGECTWPPCRRHAGACDFEHAVPYDQGGRTCACNAGARCRHHHHAKQDRGWRLDQDLPGYHRWTTPSGRTYTTGPTTYPI